jgi:hypothetical protein
MREGWGLQFAGLIEGRFMGMGHVSFKVGRGLSKQCKKRS